MLQPHTLGPDGAKAPYAELQRKVLKDLNVAWICVLEHALLGYCLFVSLRVLFLFPRPQTQDSRVRLLEYSEAKKWYTRNTPSRYIEEAPFTFPSIPVLPEFFCKTCKRADEGNVEC